MFCDNNETDWNKSEIDRIRAWFVAHHKLSIKLWFFFVVESMTANNCCLIWICVCVGKWEN